MAYCIYYTHVIVCNVSDAGLVTYVQDFVMSQQLHLKYCLIDEYKLLVACKKQTRFSEQQSHFWQFLVNPQCAWLQ